VPSPKRCPCGTGESYPACCGRFHTGAASAPTARALMRSRFSAFAVADPGYLLRTWHSSTRPQRLSLDEQVTWTRLEIVDVAGGGLFDTDGVVEFRAHYRFGTAREVLHERSTFRREDGQWRYLDGTQRRA